MTGTSSPNCVYAYTVTDITPSRNVQSIYTVTERGAGNPAWKFEGQYSLTTNAKYFHFELQEYYVRGTFSTASGTVVLTQEEFYYVRITNPCVQANVIVP